MSSNFFTLKSPLQVVKNQRHHKEKYTPNIILYLSQITASSFHHSPLPIHPYTLLISKGNFLMRLPVAA